MGPQLDRKGLVAISGWSGGRTLALLADEYAQQLYFAQLAGPKGAALPVLPFARRNDYGCVHGIQPNAMTALPSGEVFLAGTACKVDGEEGVSQHGTVLLRWGMGQSQGKAASLPKLSESDAVQAQIANIVATSSSDVFVAGTRTPPAPEGTESKDEAYLAHFDGQAWRAVTAPPTEGIDELQRAPDGKLWALYRGDLWATKGSDPASWLWENVAIPRAASEVAEHAVTSFWVRDTDDVWATVGSDDSSYLMRTKRGSEALSVPTVEAVAELSQAVDPSAGYNCEQPTLVLLTLARNAPKDLDFPSIRAALRGHDELTGKAQFIEFSFLTRRYLGVRGDADTLALVDDALSPMNIAGLETQRRCMTVSPTRTLTMDFSGPKPELPAKRATRDGRSVRQRVNLADLF